MFDAIYTALFPVDKWKIIICKMCVTCSDLIVTFILHLSYVSGKWSGFLIVQFCFTDASKRQIPRNLKLSTVKLLFFGFPPFQFFTCIKCCKRLWWSEICEIVHLFWYYRILTCHGMSMQLPRCVVVCCLTQIHNPLSLL